MWKALFLLPAITFVTVTAQAVVTDNADYSEQIEQQSAELGPFDPSLVELYKQQGVQFYQQGQLSQAAEALRLALQISRVNFGPLAAQQEPAMRALIDVADASGAGEQLDLLLQRLVDINNHQLNNPLSASDTSALLQSSQWHLGRYIQRQTSERLPSLRLALRLARHSERILKQHHDDQHASLIPALQLIAQSSYYLTEHQLVELRFFNNSNFHQQLTEQVFQQGLQAHRRIVAIQRQQQAPAQQLAEAQINLGDYLQRLQLPDASQKAYRRAWKTLHDANHQDQLADWLGQPTPLLQESQRDYTEAASLARIKAHINAEGKPQQIEVLQTYPADNSQLESAALAAAQRIPFRIAVVDGKTVPGTVEFNLPLGIRPSSEATP